MQPFLSFEDVCFSYHTLNGEIPAIQNITFSLQRGEFLAVIGPSGCGKSTILNLAAGLLTPDSGKILCEGKSPQKPFSLVGYMLQKDHLLDWLTVTDNILLGARIQGRDLLQARRFTESMLEKYQLTDFAYSYPAQLSGGMRQRVALIRTMLLSPALLLLDEPFSALDAQTRLDVSSDIGQIIRTERQSALLVTHDIAEAITLADRVLVLSASPAHPVMDLPLVFSGGLTPMEKRGVPAFQSYFDLLWRQLHETDH